MLTAARPSEAREARWAEFDLAAGTWDIPPERMKASPQGHRVFLSQQAAALLRARREFDPVFVFPSPARGKHQPISEMSLYQPLERLGLKGQIHVHGFRKSFSSWANETGAAHHDVIEAALAHRDPDEIRRTYNLAQHFERRRGLMQAWADYLDRRARAANDGDSGRAAAEQDAA
jgi:integrase